jgi:predicted dehydrogenase
VLTVPIGIHAHVPVSSAAVRGGLDVYCEKPVAATVQEVDALIRAEAETGRTVAIGFQHICSNSMRQIKKRIVDGRLGAVRRLELFCGWPRSNAYYSRNEWTGRLKLGKEWILDSPANNANAHYVMNALYLSSPHAGKAATPARVHAELYRGNEIEGPDTVQMRISCIEGAEIHIILTHANWYVNGPRMTLHCEHGRAYWQTDLGKTLIRYTGGRTEEFNNQVHDQWRFEGFRDLVEAIRERRPPLCPPELARAQTLTINAMHESCPQVAAVPSEFLSDVEDLEMYPKNTRAQFRRINDLDEYLAVAMAEDVMLSELGIPWARPGGSSAFTVNEYHSFPSQPRS